MGLAEEMNKPLILFKDMTDGANMIMKPTTLSSVIKYIG